MNATELNKKQIKFLKAKAHHLSATVTIGEQGLTKSVLKAFHEYLDAHELVKVKISADEKSDFLALAASLTEESDGAQLVGVIGRMAILYRKFPEDHAGKNPSIKLP